VKSRKIFAISESKQRTDMDSNFRSVAILVRCAKNYSGITFDYGSHGGRLRQEEDLKKAQVNVLSICQ
jgi:hypothetical protein